MRKEGGGGGEEEARTDDHLDRGGRPPGGDVRPRRPRRAGHGTGEEAPVEAVVHHVPARDELAHDDGHERDRVLETRAVIDGLRVPVYEV